MECPAWRRNKSQNCLERYKKIKVSYKEYITQLSFLRQKQHKKPTLTLSPQEKKANKNFKVKMFCSKTYFILRFPTKDRRYRQWMDILY